MATFNTYDLEDSPIKTTLFQALNDTYTPTIEFNLNNNIDQKEEDIIELPKHNVVSNDLKSKYEVEKNTSSNSSNVESAVKKFSGLKYGFGANGKNGKIDCSSFNLLVLAALGKKVPRTAAEQYKVGQKISLSDISPGDGIFYKGTYGGKNHTSHVLTFLGWNEDGTARVGESSSKGSGIHNVDLKNGYWAKHFAGVARFALNGVKLHYTSPVKTTQFKALNSTVPILDINLKGYQQLLSIPKYISKPNKTSKYTNGKWWENVLVYKPNYSITKPSNLTTDQIVNRIVRGGYATASNYGKVLSGMVKSILNLTGNNKAFVDRRMKSYLSRGLDLNTALVYTALDAYESGYGTHVSGTHNYGGVKGKGKVLTTKEEKNGKTKVVKLEFRNFINDDEYTDYKINLLNLPRYNLA